MRLLVLAFALLTLADRAHADVISLGTLSFETSIIGAANHFVVGNFTGGQAAPPDFPVLTPLTFVNASLVLTHQSSGVETIPLGSLGPGQHPTIDYLLTDLFTQAQFTATLLAPVFALAGGDTFVPSTTSITADLLALAGALVADQDVVTIDLEGTRVPGVPEPTSVVLLIASAAAPVLTRLRRRRRSRA